MRYDRDRKARTRERVLREAAAAIRAEGSDRIGVASIMARAGLTQGGFYAHFASKDALVAEAVGQMFSEAAEAYAGHDPTDDPDATLGRYVDAYVSMRHRDSRDRGCPVPILAGELHRLPEAARQRFTTAVGRMQRKLVELLRQAGTDRPEERALVALAEMIGAVALARVVDDPDAETLLTAARASVREKLGLVETRVSDGPAGTFVADNRKKTR